VHAKDIGSPINTGAILSTIEVVANLPLVVGESTVYVSEGGSLHREAQG
jgi:hypothetical protein